MLSRPQLYTFALSPVGNAQQKVIHTSFLGWEPGHHINNFTTAWSLSKVTYGMFSKLLPNFKPHCWKFLQKCFSFFLSFFFSFHFSITPFYKYSLSKGMLWHFCSKGAFSFISAGGYRIAHGIFNCELLAPSGRSYRQKYFYRVSHLGV